MDLGFYLEQFGLWWSVVTVMVCDGLWWSVVTVVVCRSVIVVVFIIVYSHWVHEVWTDFCFYVTVLGCSVKPQTPPCGVKWNCCVGQLSRPVPGWVPVHRRWLHHQRTLSSVAAQCGTDWPAGPVRSQSGGTIGSWLLFIFTSPENIYLSHIFK